LKKNGINKYNLSTREPWYNAELSPKEIERILYHSNKKGSFFIRKPSKETRLEDGSIHKYTIECFVGKNTHIPLVKRSIYQTKDENKYWISAETFSSLIEIVYYFKKKPIYNEQVLTDPPELSFSNTVSPNDVIFLYI
jgi:hypothetical protein